MVKRKIREIDSPVFLKNWLLHSLFNDFMLKKKLDLQSVEVKLFLMEKKHLFFFFWKKGKKKLHFFQTS